MRMHLSRKKVHKIKQTRQGLALPQAGLEGNYESEVVRETEARIGPFQPGPRDPNDVTKTENRGPTKVENNALYTGEWNAAGNKRHGLG